MRPNSRQTLQHNLLSSRKYCDCNSPAFIFLSLPCTNAITPPSAAVAFTAGAIAATYDARALEAQTERRAARRAARERGIKERAREASANLGRGGWKGPRTVDSTNFAKDLKLGIAKQVRCVLHESKAGLGRQGGMRVSFWGQAQHEVSISY